MSAILLFLLLFAPITPAQDATPPPPIYIVHPACSNEDLGVIITGIETNLGVMRQARMLGNQSLIMGVLDGLHAMITATRTACSPLNFSSADSGIQTEIEAVDIEAGVYLATAITDGPLRVVVTPQAGDCGIRGEGPLFALERGEAEDGMEALFWSEDCVALIAISEATVPWTLTFIKLHD